MNRINPEEVLKAYESKGVKATSIWFENKYDGVTRRCGIGVLFYGVVPEEKVLASATAKYGEDYTKAFISGFDGIPIGNGWTTLSKEGAEDGWAARQLVQTKYPFD